MGARFSEKSFPTAGWKTEKEKFNHNLVAFLQ